MKKGTGIILISAAVLLLFIQGCTTVNNLEEYDLRNSAVYMDMGYPPQPQVNIDYGYADADDDQLMAIIQMGANIVKMSEAEKAERKMLAALEGQYIPEYAAELTFDRLVKMLDGTMVGNSSKADFILEIDIEEYGLEAYSFTGNVAMFFEMTAALYHPGDNEIVWRRRVSVERDLTPGLFGFDPLLGNVVSIAGLNQLDEAELAEGFKALTYDVTEETVGRLRDDLRKARKR